MMLAVSASGPEPGSGLDPRFGRAAWFVLYDTEKKSYSALDNKPNLEAAQGAGVQSAARIAESGAAALLTGHCGPKAFRALRAAGVKVYPAREATVREAVAAFEAGGLQELEGPDVEGHW